MRNIDISVNGHSYTLACDDGQEHHVEQLAGELDSRARQIAGQIPTASENMILVMTALMLADEHYESRGEAGDLHEQLAKLSDASFDPSSAAAVSDEQMQHSLASMMDEVAQQLEGMTRSLEKTA